MSLSFWFFEMPHAKKGKSLDIEKFLIWNKCVSIILQCPQVENNFPFWEFCKMSKGVELHSFCLHISVYCLTNVLFFCILTVMSVEYITSSQDSQGLFSPKLVFIRVSYL